MAVQAVQKKIKTAVNRQRWLDRLSDPVQTAVQAVYQKSGLLGQKIQDFLNGTWLGHPLHPVITDVTVGALTAAVVLDGLDVASGEETFAPGADAALVLGVTSAVGAAAAGLTDWQHTQGEARRVGMLHAGLNSVSLVLYMLSLGFRKNRQRGAGQGLALAGYLFSVAAAYLGGDLVYRQKIGVNHSRQEPITRDFTPVLSSAELAEGQMVKAKWKSAKILLARINGEVLAMNDTCAHQGGPLSEGELCADSSVVCPWHQSRFNLRTGAVINGPSAFPQPRYEAREQNGMIEIRQPAEINQ